MDVAIYYSRDGVDVDRLRSERVGEMKYSNDERIPINRNHGRGGGDPWGGRKHEWLWADMPNNRWIPYIA
jgi:hypothetical protein